MKTFIVVLFEYRNFDIHTWKKLSKLIMDEVNEYSKKCGFKKSDLQLTINNMKQLSFMNDMVSR